MANVQKSKPRKESPVLRTCVVCGHQSHRLDWIKKSGDFVACDFHSNDEISKAVAKPSEVVKAEVAALRGRGAVPVAAKPAVVAGTGQTANPIFPANPPDAIKEQTK